jgi:hypothetical protein
MAMMMMTRMTTTTMIVGMMMMVNVTMMTTKMMLMNFDEVFVTGTKAVDDDARSVAAGKTLIAAVFVVADIEQVERCVELTRKMKKKQSPDFQYHSHRHTLPHPLPRHLLHQQLDKIHPNDI